MDLFILISGYYGIRIRWESLLSFGLLCVFNNLIALLIQADSHGVGDFVNALFILRTPNWFFPAYFGVMMCSPILNKALDTFEIKTLQLLAVMGIVLVGISSWRFANPDSNTALPMMVIYFLGGYIRRERMFDKVNKCQSLFMFFAWALVGFVVAVVVYDCFHKEFGIFFQHNSFIVLGMAVSLLLIFRRLAVRSRFVNVWASTVVARAVHTGCNSCSGAIWLCVEYVTLWKGKSACPVDNCRSYRRCPFGCFCGGMAQKKGG